VYVLASCGVPLIAEPDLITTKTESPLPPERLNVIEPWLIELADETFGLTHKDIVLAEFPLMFKLVEV
jgi:hypothetical protein